MAFLNASYTFVYEMDACSQKLEAAMRISCWKCATRIVKSQNLKPNPPKSGDHKTVNIHKITQMIFCSLVFQVNSDHLTVTKTGPFLYLIEVLSEKKTT